MAVTRQLAGPHESEDRCGLLPVKGAMPIQHQLVLAVGKGHQPIVTQLDVKDLHDVREQSVVTLRLGS